MPRWPWASRVSQFSSNSPFLTTSTDDDYDQLVTDEWLVKLEAARLEYPGSKNSSLPHPLDLVIQPARKGGHAVLARNARGKSLLSQALTFGAFEGPEHPHVSSGTVQHFHVRRPSVARVSFESHQDLLAMGGTTYSALTPFGGLLSKAAQFLVVRFGLYPHLHRDIDTLSTGEIRKVLLVRALSTRPNLLILDNAFDGLDVASRQSLAELVSMTIRGFTPDILVQGVNAKNTAHTQVLLSTHRPEEIVDEISTVTFIGNDKVWTEKRNGRSGHELFQSALGHSDEVESDPWEDTMLPSLDEIANLWNHGRDGRSESASTGPIVEAKNLRVSRGEKDLISALDWNVLHGERWILAGGNGAGKSTLSRLLTNEKTRQVAVDDGVLHVDTENDANIGWVSTERHLSLSQSTQTVREVILGHGSEASGRVAPEIGAAVAEWLGVGEDQLSRTFSDLSQGEQKLVLIASAIAKRPKLLIIDEPLQALDGFHRRLVLGLVERVCRATDTSLIYVTHHFEELIPSITHVLHLDGGKAVFNGALSAYDPEVM